jgi:acyl-CoA thioester hydrolase
MAEQRVLTARGTVYPWQCDHMGHMNVMWYVGKFDEATWQLLTSLGLAPSRLQKENRGMVAAEQHIQYKRELRAGDVVTVRSAVLDVKDKVIRFTHEMTNDETGEVAAVTILVGIYFDTAARKAASIPADIRERALRMVIAAPKLPADSKSAE